MAQRATPEDIAELRYRADSHIASARRELAGHLGRTGNLDELRAREAAGDKQARWELLERLNPPDI